MGSPLKGQLVFGYDGRSFYESVTSAFRGALVESVHSVTLKQAAFDLDLSPSYLANCVADRQRNHLRADWVPYLIDKAPHDAALEILADLRGLELVPKKTLTPEEELRALREAMAETLGPDIRAIVEHKAKRSR